MTMRIGIPPSRFLPVLAALAAAPVLTSCGGSSAGLIPSAAAGPLQSDFEEVVQAAEAGDGTCTGTENALLKTERDYGALPLSVDAGLRARLREGIAKLRVEALALCVQPHPQATVTSTTSKPTAPAKTTPTSPTTTPATTTPTTPTTSTPTPPTEGGGTPAPGAGGAEPPAGGEQGAGGSPSPGAGQPGAGEGNGAGAGGEGPAGGGR